MSKQSTRTTNTQAKKQEFLKGLVAEYGEGTVVTRKQLLAVWEKNKDAYPHPVSVEKDMNFRVARNQFIVTTSSNPASVRDQTVSNMTKLQAKKEETMLSKATRTSPSKLAKEVMGEDVAGEEVNDEEDINALLKTVTSN